MHYLAVVSPGAEIPSRRITFPNVIARMREFSRRFQRFPYQISRQNFTSQLIAFRPFTSISLAIPGSNVHSAPVN